MGFLGLDWGGDGGKDKDSGFGIYVLGIPLIEGPKAADKRRNDRTDRREIEEASDVAKRKSKDKRRIENTESRNEQQVLSSYWRNADGSNPSESIVGSIAGAVPGTVAGIASAINPLAGLGSFWGSLGSSAPPLDLNTILVGGLIIGGLVIATRE